MKLPGRIAQSVKIRIAGMVIVDEKSGCWLWQGAVNRGGYGRINVGSRRNSTRKVTSAHRASYQEYVGEIPDGMEVCHVCDVRLCCNPAHLFVGTRQDNIDDRQAKGRNINLRGTQQRTAKLTETAVLDARKMRLSGASFGQIARHYGINKKTAMQAVKGVRWSHVQMPEPPKG